jgi:cyclopropane fatty-acyl-phospholipid synthase-like methyltransferase
MEQSTGYFAQSLVHKKILTPGLRILDFGCGPGYLTQHLTGTCTSYVGLDISENYIETCKKTFGKKADYQFYCLHPEPNTSGLASAALPESSFDLIIINSVIQYFSSKEAVVDLLTASKKLLTPKGRIILADVVTQDKGLYRDALAVLKHSIQHRYFWAFMHFMYQARVSGYNETRKKQPLLSVTEEEIKGICTQLSLQCTLLPRCTLQVSRNSYAIGF